MPAALAELLAEILMTGVSTPRRKQFAISCYSTRLHHLLGGNGYQDQVTKHQVLTNLPFQLLIESMGDKQTTC